MKTSCFKKLDSFPHTRDIYILTMGLPTAGTTQRQVKIGSRCQICCHIIWRGLQGHQGKHGNTRQQQLSRNTVLRQDEVEYVKSGVNLQVASEGLLELLL
jgi:hypothetical protein